MKLKGISLKGKNRIREHGDTWDVVEDSNNVPCLNNRPGFLIKSPDGDLRWIAKQDDDNFEIVA
jgi:hypothetical protein